MVLKATATMNISDFGPYGKFCQPMYCYELHFIGHMSIVSIGYIYILPIISILFYLLIGPRLRPQSMTFYQCRAGRNEIPRTQVTVHPTRLLLPPERSSGRLKRARVMLVWAPVPIHSEQLEHCSPANHPE